MALAIAALAAISIASTRGGPVVDLFDDATGRDIIETSGQHLGRSLVDGSTTGPAIDDAPVAIARVVGSTDTEPGAVVTAEPASTSAASSNDVEFAQAATPAIETEAQGSLVPQAPAAQPAATSDPVQSVQPAGVTPTQPLPTVAPQQPGQPGRSTPTQPTPTVAPASPQTPAPDQQRVDGPWCEVEVRAEDGLIRWNDDGKTPVLRRNDNWLHTPDERALAVLVPDRVDTSDDYVVRLWGNGDSEDVDCSFATRTNLSTPASAIEIVGATTTTTSAPTTTAPTTAAPTPTVARPVVAAGPLPAPIAIPGGPVQFGFNVDLWAQNRTNYWNELEAVPGNGRLIAHEFKSFNKRIDTDTYRWHMEQGRDLLLTWNGTNASTILNGSQDEWIRQHARALKSLPGTVMLRFWHEPDVSYKIQWIEGDPQNFIDSWMHVRQIFVEEGAVDNIEWVWCPTAWRWAEQGARFYPGDANVDWICADGYSGWRHDQPLPEIIDAFTEFQAWANQHPTKPILIAEFGATRREPGVRAQWVEGIRTWVNASPNIRAVVYFDFDRRPQGEDYDWRIRTEPDAWAAVKNLLSSAPFGR